jgi:excisionase family DNA binding protein
VNVGRALRPQSLACIPGVPPITFILAAEAIEQIAQRAAELVTRRETAEPWLTTEQAAAHLGLSASQLYTLVSQRRRNGLPVTKEGSRSYFRATELDAWREGKR